VVIAPRDPAVAGPGARPDRWDPDRERELGIDALLHGFERLLP